MMVLVGLGNPGPEHAHQRHNIGFMAIEALAARYDFGPWRAKFQSLITEGRVPLVGGAEQRVVAVKPQTFMNLSGEAVSKVLAFYKVTPSDLMVIHDDLDLVPGRLRIKRGGGAGGHNGLRSIDAHVGPDYLRVRLGIGHPGHKDAVIGYVLHDFAKADGIWMGPLLDTIGAEFPRLAGGDAEGFASRVASKLQPTTHSAVAKETEHGV